MGLGLVSFPELREKLDRRIEYVIFEDNDNVRTLIYNIYQSLKKKHRETQSLAIPMSELIDFRKRHPEYSLSKDEFSIKDEFFYVEDFICSISFDDLVDLKQDIIDAMEESSEIPLYVYEQVFAYEDVNAEWEKKERMEY